MHSIKIIAFSCFLLCSYSSYSSAPARLPIDSDELEIPEIHLVQKKAAQNRLEFATKDLRDLAKKLRNKDLVKKIHQAYCASEKHWADLKRAKQFIDDCGQQDVSQGLRDEVQAYKTLGEQQGQKWLNLTNQAQGDQLRSVFCLENRQNNVRFAQALLLRAEKEELIKEKDVQIKQQTAQIQQKDFQIQQRDAEINQLRAALQRQAPAAHPIADASHQTPPPPYAQ